MADSSGVAVSGAGGGGVPRERRTGLPGANSSGVVTVTGVKDDAAQPALQHLGSRKQLLALLRGERLDAEQEVLEGGLHGGRTAKCVGASNDRA